MKIFQLALIPAVSITAFSVEEMFGDNMPPINNRISKTRAEAQENIANFIDWRKIAGLNSLGSRVKKSEFGDNFVQGGSGLNWNTAENPNFGRNLMDFFPEN